MKELGKLGSKRVYSNITTMSRQRKSEVKDTNISSKLLGANVSDINIEKFRDLSLIRKDRYDLGGKITVPILKTLTNKFSPFIYFQDAPTGTHSA